MKKIINDYIDRWYQNQNDGCCNEQKGLYSKKKYYLLLKNVVKIIMENRGATINELRDIIYVNSGVNTKLYDFIIKKGVVPGAVISYGTPNFQETIVIGNKEELVVKKGKVMPSYKKMTANTIFDLASVTKFFVVMSIMKLSEDNLINLNEDITKYDSRFEKLSGITIKDLLSFNVRLKTMEWIGSQDNKADAEKLIFNIEKDTNKNGKLYSDLNSIILKYIVEMVTGIKYYDFLKTTFFDKLNMNNTFVVVPENKLKFVASNNFDTRIEKNGKLVTDIDNFKGVPYDQKAQILEDGSTDLPGHAGLFSSTSDMVKLLKGIINLQVLNRESLVEISKNRQGKIFYDESGNRKYTQYYGYMVYTKHPEIKYSEVYHGLSGHSFASAGWTGTQMTVDFINKLYFFLGTNKGHNRITYVDENECEYIIERRGKKGMIMPDATFKIDSSKFSYERDSNIVHPIMNLLIQYKMLEDILELNGIDNFKEEKRTRYIFKNMNFINKKIS